MASLWASTRRGGWHWRGSTRQLRALGRRDWRMKDEGKHTQGRAERGEGRRSSVALARSGGGYMAVTWRLHGGYMAVTWRLHGERRGRWRTGLSHAWLPSCLRWMQIRSDVASVVTMRRSGWIKSPPALSSATSAESPNAAPTANCVAGGADGCGRGARTARAGVRGGGGRGVDGEGRAGRGE